MVAWAYEYGFFQVCAGGGKRERRKKHSKSFIFPVSTFVEKKKIHKAVQNNII
jgi:hypothetical protein